MTRAPDRDPSAVCSVGPGLLCALALNALTLSVVFAQSTGSARELAILPSEVHLRGSEALQRLILVEREGDVVRSELREGLEWRTSDPRVMVVENSIARPRGNGEARIEVRVDERSASVPVRVEAFDEPFRWSFRNHVQSVLARRSCNSGACHGAVAGQNGFKLSLRGYDPDGDWLAITRHAGGRRIAPDRPERSLLLTKPTAVLAHKGGLRLEPGSRDYRVLSRWIAAGAPPPAADDAVIERIEVLPERSLLEMGDQVQILVQALFSDGRREDVTAWTKFSNADAAVLRVDDGSTPGGENGRVTVEGHGEGAVTAWYASQLAVARVTSPHRWRRRVDERVQAAIDAAPRRGFIDELVLEQLARLRIPPSPPAGASTFLRRVFLDTIGRLPTREDVERFLADESSDKRDRLIDDLLARPEYVDYQTYKWSDLLLVNSKRLSTSATAAYSRWIRDRVAAATPWDEFARALLTSRGSTLENGATNFFILHQNPTEMAETASLAFLGMSIACAKCHNHPLEKWTNDQYFGMANLFSRVRSKDAPGDGNRIVFSAVEGELVQPLRGRPQIPRPLDGEPIPPDSREDRRGHLADWLVAPENPWFARAAVNRVWASLLGVGLVEKVDDLRRSNPASNERLLAALAEWFVESGFDIRALQREILRSATYQTSSVTTRQNAADTRSYSHFYPRRLRAEVLLDALSQATGSPTSFPGYPRGWRALQLPDSNVSSYFLESFGRPERVQTCSCERNEEPSMAQVLHLVNGDTLSSKLGDPRNRLSTYLSKEWSPARVIEDAWLRALSRRPTEEESRRLLEVLAETPASDAAKPDGEARRAAWEDLYWSLLSSREFLFQH